MQKMLFKPLRMCYKGKAKCVWAICQTGQGRTNTLSQVGISKIMCQPFVLMLPHSIFRWTKILQSIVHEWGIRSVCPTSFTCVCSFKVCLPLIGRGEVCTLTTLYHDIDSNIATPIIKFGARSHRQCSLVVWQHSNHISTFKSFNIDNKSHFLILLVISKRKELIKKF